MIQLLSVVGAILILAAYVGVQTNRLQASSLAFSLLNLAGAGFLTAVAIVEEQVGFILLEGVWSVVSLAGVVRALRATGDPESQT